MLVSRYAIGGAVTAYSQVAVMHEPLHNRKAIVALPRDSKLIEDICYLEIIKKTICSCALLKNMFI